MTQLELLRLEYAKHAATPWVTGLSGAEKTWFVVYDPADERRIRARLEDFALATREANHKWAAFDCTDLFARWIGTHEYRDAYFTAPADLEMSLVDFKAFAAEEVIAMLRAADEEAVVALTGVGAFFGLIRLSELLKAVEGDIRGRLAVFFPGTYEGNTYRLLDARDGWNYLATPITANKGVTTR